MQSTKYKREKKGNIDYITNLNSWTTIPLKS